MKLFASYFPLLLKELQEQAVRRRTVVIRLLLAIIAYLIFVAVYGSEVSRIGRQALGQGEEVFVCVVVMQFLAVFLIFPAFLVGSIAQEKENDTLQLLIVSRMTPGRILFQKLMAKTIPFLSLLALTVPLLGLSFALGGVESQQIISLIYVVGLSILNVGCLTLLISTWSGSSVAAFIGVYLIGFVIYLGPGFFAEMFHIYPDKPYWRLFPFAAYAIDYRSGLATHVANTWYLWLGSFVYFALAKLLFIPRAFVKPRGIVRRLFRAVDQEFDRINDEILGGVRLGRRRAADLPEDDPIRWRELHRRGMNRMHHMVRVTLFFAVPATMIGLFATGHSNYWRYKDWTATGVFVLWGIAALVVTVVSANAIVAERTRQTLDVLLTIPWTMERIIREKRALVNRWILVFAIALGCLFGIEALFEGSTFRVSGNSWRSRTPLPGLIHFTLTLGLVFLYLPMISWLAMGIGLRAKSRARGSVQAVIAVALWQVLPAFAFFLVLLVTGFRHGDDLVWIMMASPAFFVVYLEFFVDFNEIFGDSTVLPVIVNYAGYALLTVWLRRWCLRGAVNKLGRIEENAEATGRSAIRGVDL
ncbi:MAG: ABC transporter permease, partial [Planctomycetes bacterium]|nr:ABC transporter permease [Planctomycetota bacterium]